MNTLPTAAQPSLAENVERVLVKGDLSGLSTEERVYYYNRVCDSVGLNPLTRPFEYVTLSGKLQLYARKDATDQLRALHKISVVDVKTAAMGDMYIVTTKVCTADGRPDMATGVVPLGNAKGELLANLMMKAETKSKRRATLSVCGLGFLDETEVETIPGAEPQTRAIEHPSYAEGSAIADDELPGDLGPPDFVHYRTGYSPPEGDSPQSQDVIAADKGGAAPKRQVQTVGVAPPESLDARLREFQQELEVAAESGADELARAWRLIPPSDRRGAALEAILRRCQRRAAEIDDAARM